MRFLLSIAAILIFALHVSAGTSEVYSCSIGGYPTGVVTMTIELLDDTLANVNQSPPLVRIQNPVQIARDAQTGTIRILASAEVGPFPGRPQVQTITITMFLDQTKPALKFPPNGKEKKGIEIPCTKL